MERIQGRQMWAAGVLVWALGLGCSNATSTPDANAVGVDAATAGGQDAGPPPDAAMPVDAGVGDPAVLVGGFQLVLAPAATSSDGLGHASLVGKVYDRPTPAALIWEGGQAEGGCVLKIPRVPFCATPCGGSAVCVEDGVCQPYPTSKSVGAVTVEGVHTVDGGTLLELSAVANTYQVPASATLAFPPVDEGAAVSVHAAGSAFNGSFVLESRGVAPLVLAGADLALEPGAPLQVAYQAAGSSGVSTIKALLDISHHGGSKGRIECEAQDTGVLTIPAALVTQLLALGVAGYPTIVVTRLAVGSSVIGAGRVDFTVSSPVEVPVAVPGLTSCTEDAQCPQGTTCQTALFCR